MLQMRVSFRRFRLIVSLYSHNVYPYYSKIVLVAIQDEGSRFGPAAFDALRRLGATDPILNDYRGSYALAGFSGINKPSWVTQQQANSGKGPSEISLKVTIGKYISTELYNSTFKSDAIIFFPGMHAHQKRSPGDFLRNPRTSPTRISPVQILPSRVINATCALVRYTSKQPPQSQLVVFSNRLFGA